MDDREKKSFDFAGDVTKQLITLSIGIMTLCIAFTDKIFSYEAARSNSCLIFAALTFFAVSIISGILTLLKLIGIIANNHSNNEDSSIYDSATRFFSVVQIVTFLIAVICSMSFVGCSLSKGQKNLKGQTTSDSSRKDSLYIEVKCNVPTNINNKVKRKHKKTTEPCYKYVRINTCSDTIVKKAFVVDDK